jgi:hypothetical protein
MAVCLSAALLCHYYAALVCVPVAGAEAYRSWKARRIDWPIWMAMAAGSTPLVWRFASIHRVVSGFTATSWSEVYPVSVLDFWNEGLQRALSVLVLALAAMALWGWKSHAAPETPDRRTMPRHELLAGMLFLAIPVLVVGFGLLVTHVYSPRYALLGFAGVALLLPAVVARLSGGRSLVAFAMLALAASRLIVAGTSVPPPRDPLAEEDVLMDALKQGPVVVADGQLFMQMWLYLPEPLKSNLIFLVDREASAKYQTFNTSAIDAALTDVRRWYPMRVLDYRSFATSGKEFRLLQNPLKPGWLLEKIAADGGAEVIDRYTPLRQLYRIRVP